jgi:Leucine-rich repeat (LRR) protein
LSQNEKLEFFDCRFNSVESIEDVDVLFPWSLKTVLLSSNQIHGVLQPRYLSFLENLEEVDLSQNPLIDVLGSQR